uniref:Ras association domain-containing protein 8 n=2 Tax=Ascaris TaxID=6251 RepID=F1L158_ASCSU
MLQHKTDGLRMLIPLPQHLQWPIRRCKTSLCIAILLDQHKSSFLSSCVRKGIDYLCTGGTPSLSVYQEAVPNAICGMELKVNVDGVERSVSGLTESTTCAQIIYALAHATGQKGRFVLVEKYRDAERSLAPTDRPLEMLRKWDQHSQPVSFVLKHLEGSASLASAICNSSLSDTESSCASQPTQSSNNGQKNSLSYASQQSRKPLAPGAMNEFVAQSALVGDDAPHRISTSSSTGYMRSVLSLASRGLQQFDTQPAWQHQFHSASFLPAAQTGSLRNRPPPPAYHEVIERRYNSLTRGASCSTTRPNTFLNADRSYSHDSTDRSTPASGSQSSADGVADIAQDMNLSLADLERLVQSQQRTIEQQKARLAQLDISVNDDDLREIMQLERQQANLRLVLNPLRAFDWPARLQAEKAKVHELRLAVADLKHKIDLLSREVQEKVILEMKISEEIEAVKREVLGIEGADVNDIEEREPFSEMLTQ